jgi:2-haloacid dehalogenase
VSDSSKPAEVISMPRRRLALGLALASFLTSGAGATMMSSPSAPLSKATPARPIIVFDVNETLLDFNVLAPVFTRVFGDPAMLREWFDQVVLYSEALTLSGHYANSAVVGVAVLNMLAQIKGRAVAPSDLEALKRFSATMPTYDDTPAALATLKQAGLRLVTLSNNPSASVESQLTHAGIRSFFDELHSIDDQVQRYKPARESYLSLAAKLGVTPADLWLVSCHAFDTLGAAAAGYHTALVLRPQNAPISLGQAPDLIANDLRTIATRIVNLTVQQSRDKP